MSTDNCVEHQFVRIDHNLDYCSACATRTGYSCRVRDARVGLRTSNGPMTTLIIQADIVLRRLLDCSYLRLATMLRSTARTNRYWLQGTDDQAQMEISSNIIDDSIRGVRSHGR
jgi:hypothetical protein